MNDLNILIKKILKHKTFKSVYELSSAAGNHMFDDNPEEFGLTLQEAYYVRGYFQTYDTEDVEGIDSLINNKE